MKIILLFAVLLQVSTILKDIFKSAPKSTGKVVQTTIKALKTTPKLSKASKLLVADDLFRVSKLKNKSILKNEFKSEVSIIELSASDGSQIKKVKQAEKSNLEKSIDEMVEHKIEDAIEEQLFESISRSNEIWDYAMFQFMLKDNWKSVCKYFRINHDFNLINKLDLFLLMNEKTVDNFRLSRRDLCRLMAKTNIYKSNCLDVLIVNLSGYQHIVDRLEMYATKHKIHISKSKK